MPLVLSEEQESIKKTARELLSKRAPISLLRRLRDTHDEAGFSRDVWAELADLGLVGVLGSEALGGAGLGYAELGVVLEECGRTLYSNPYLSTVVLGAGAVAAGGDDELRREVLPRVAGGDLLLGFAHEEGTKHAPYRVATRATAARDGFVISGAKTFVLDGHVAGAFVVVARTSGNDSDRDGLSLFFVPAAAPGTVARRRALVDSRNVAAVRFTDVEVPARHILGELGKGADLLDRLLDRATIALSAEMLGGALEAFERTVEYLKVRRQFGVPIGTFQALKHRAAQMFSEIELSRSIVLAALRAVDENRPDVPLLASAAKARLTDTFLLVANEAIQMHGGIGATDELDIGFFLKRARVAEMTFGDAAYHRDRFGRLQGY